MKADEISWWDEYQKCKKSPWYFATNYINVYDGETLRKFTTILDEETFNKIFHDLERSISIGSPEPKDAGDKEIPAGRKKD